MVCVCCHDLMMHTTCQTPRHAKENQAHFVFAVLYLPLGHTTPCAVFDALSAREASRPRCFSTSKSGGFLGMVAFFSCHFPNAVDA